MGENATQAGSSGEADLADRRRPVWVVPDTVPAIVPRSTWVTQPPWVAVYRWAAIGGDLLAAVIGASVALLTRFGYQVGAGYLVFGSLLPLAWVAAVGLARGYESRSFGSGAEEFRSILRSGVGLTAVVAIVSYATKSEIARGFVVLAIPVTVVIALLLRYGLRRDLSRHRYRGRCMRRVLVVGRNGEAATLRERLEKRPADGYRVVAVCRPRGDIRPGTANPPDSLDEADIMAAVNRHSVDVVAIAADPELSGQSLRRLSWALEQQGVELIVSPGIIEVAGPRISVRPVAGLSLLHLERPSASAGPHLLKNVFDRVMALILVTLALPLLLGLALAVRLTSRGPVLFRQRRVGRGNTTFTMFKFRTMVVDAEARLADLTPHSDGNTVLFKLRSDPRVTKVGGFLRRYSLDELPQLLNVLRGEMSLVGPRPPLESEVAKYAADDTRRMLVKPGLTGLWQVSGRSDLSWDDSVLLDLRYVDNWSMTLDLLILWKTARAVLKGSGAY
ncbi:Undecaprenyl-phosphate galactose phosphotransferase WbaP/exopolysaccharide biosynthesis polyprenyl glycosylphosphotransferase [Kribbella amoyensis]|uniref:Undecaprenyl-phosphate galactose phosphotransferase WbaP/exopolysaccharide biosynthesis polyprenyl glycosylphosphotransferase n=1 Tax=Kribbella amoyensis TaxID=996641 RepID=A0A561BWJ5_9ACTN|nr:sugar transferase [Kribbella amoyensis]TWD83266.1 Undecaprenyl-phosphate galactose phosphotransferase WbaP/exopolysaccharide biosynthesis polyprenyl glycosylphosphotransferase [Kribbella amoyensis]